MVPRIGGPRLHNLLLNDWSIFMLQELMIVTVDCPNKDVLKRKTENIEPDELQFALEIGDKLFQALKPNLPAAGLAAP